MLLRTRWRSLLSALVAACLALTMLTAPVPAAAEVTTRISWTRIGIYPRTSPSMAAGHAASALPDGVTVTIACETTGEPVSNGYQTITIWDRLTDGSWLPNAFLDTGTASGTPGVPRCDTTTDRATSDPAPTVNTSGYDRIAAAVWAIQHYDDPERFPDADCTWYVTNALWAAGLPKTPQWTGNSHDLDRLASRRDWLTGGPTKTTANPDALINYLTRRGLATKTRIDWSDNSAGGAQVGDLIGYDWDTPTPDGTIDHLAIITKIDDTGYPLRSQHTPARLNAGWTYDPTHHTWIEHTHPGWRRQAWLIHLT